MKKTIVGLTGAAGSGKSTLAVALACEPAIKAAFSGVYCMRFAEELKRIAREEMGWDGEKDERGRRLLQVLGTECGRAYNPNIWIDKLMARIDDITDEGPTLILIDDMRFDNEAQAVRSRGGKVVLLENRAYDLKENATHSSELGVSDSLIDFKFDSSHPAKSKEFQDSVTALAKIIFYYLA